MVGRLGRGGFVLCVFHQRPRRLKTADNAQFAVGLSPARLFFFKFKLNLIYLSL